MTRALDVDKLSGADLRAFAAADNGTRAVLVELSRPGPLAVPPAIHRTARGGRPAPRELAPRESAAPAEDDDVRMDALERALAALMPVAGPVRFDLARAFALTVTPAALRDLTRLELVGVVRPRQVVQSA